MIAPARVRSALTSCRPGKAGALVSSFSRTPSNFERKYYEDFIRRMVMRRIELGITQEQLGDRLGVASGLVAKWECVDRLPSLFMLICWAGSLGLVLVPVG